jgi:hypothetical protein
MKTAAYNAGMSDALEHFGVRMASDLMFRRMPDGPEHLGAEWLARQLSSQNDSYKVNPVGRAKRQNHPVHWGPKTSVGDNPVGS